MTAGLVVRDVRGLEEMEACEALYGEVMRLRPADGSINPRLLIALQHNSGHVLGAFVDDRLVGFAYSFLARDEDGPVPELYQYSQLTVVASHAQDQGIGRRLKHAQRDRCRAGGIGSIRWAFDPLRVRNAHFNLDVLGATVTRLVPAMYGSRGFGADLEDATDRFIAEWRLDDEPVPYGDRPLPAGRDWPLAAAVPDGEAVLVAVPASWERYRSRVGTSAAAGLREELRSTFADLLAAGRFGVSCQVLDPEVAVYRFERLGHRGAQG